MSTLMLQPAAVAVRPSTPLWSIPGAVVQQYDRQQQQQASAKRAEEQREKQAQQQAEELREKQAAEQERLKQLEKNV